MSDPGRWLDEGSDDSLRQERDLLRSGLMIDPPDGAQDKVWASVLAQLGPGPMGGGPGSGLGGPIAAKAGIDPWEFRHRNAIRPGRVLPNGQVADEATGLVECLEALKPDYDADPGAGLAVAFKNSGLGMGVPDTGRCVLSVEEGRVHVRTSAADMGQGVAQMALHPEWHKVLFPPPPPIRKPDQNPVISSEAPKP